MPRNTSKTIALTAEQERTAFAQRLNAALAAADVPASATVVQREFNIRNPQQPVTIHAARKWITGESIPSQQRLQILSAWLKVKPNWLRFGDDSEDMGGNATTVDEQMLLRSFRRLSARERKKLLALIQTVAQERGKG
jgi:ATP/maltotriose-dependent transcriptional regulator MalT